MQGPALLGGIVYLVLLVLGIFLTLYWLFFPYLVYSKLKSIQEEAEQANGYLKVIAERMLDAELPTPANRASGSAASPPPYPVSPMVTCQCRHCGKPIQFNRDGFDPANPATVACPHCGEQTQLSLIR